MDTSPSRSQTPESPWTSSLQDASATVDDLTAALANFSRVPSPEPAALYNCCCGRDNCENHQTWSAYKSKLESRLILSAEVGQALLRRHEAYVRRNGRRNSAEDFEKQLETEIRELRTNNVALEKRLAQALVNSEVTETSNKVVLQELQETRASLTRLTTQQVRSVGLESRLSIVIQELEDMQQERNSADQRAKLAEARIVALRDRCSRMQDQLNNLHRDLEEQRSNRLELSEEVLQGARAQLKALHHLSDDRRSLDQDDEITKMIETLVVSNETLKRDNAEVQRLLSESREDSRALREELEELRASENHKYARHRFTNSIHSVRSAPLSPRLSSSFGFNRFGKRAVSAERGSRRSFEPLTPETSYRPLSPMDSWNYPSPLDGQDTPSRLDFELDEGSQRDHQHERAKSQKTLLLLTRSRGVQTEAFSGLLSLSPIPTLFEHSAPPSHDERSEVSSQADLQPSTISSLLDRASSLLQRLIASDARTLTTRLKRQHLVGADVGHLSRATVGTIVSEATMLRTNFRTLLDDEKIVTTLTRKDLRALFNFLKDAFTEMGDLRMTLNDVVLDPSAAGKISEAVLNEGKSVESGSSSATGWIAPIAKLFGSTFDDTSTNRAPPVRSTSRGRQGALLPGSQRIIPKLGPATSASATTVNVEFHGAGVGRPVTSTYSAHSTTESGSKISEQSTAGGMPHQLRSSSSIMGIFAGAPRPLEAHDPWIVVPKPQRKPISPLALLDEAAARAMNDSAAFTVGRSATRDGREVNKLPRAVDAVIDLETNISPTDPPSDFQTTLLQRTLRPRGLSDSSIRTTFINHGEEQQRQQQHLSEQRIPGESSNPSVLAAFSRKVLALSRLFHFKHAEARVYSAG